METDKPKEEPKQFTPEMLIDLKQGLDNAIQKSNPLFPNYNFLNKKEEPKQEENEIIDISDHDGIGNAVDNLNNEPPQETLEEFALKNSKYTNHSNINHLKEEAIILGAKWQQERSYSEEDLRRAICTSFLLGVDRGIYSKEVEDKIINQFKKK
jgi:hypothetical protein